QHTDETFINQERPAKVGKTSVPVQDTPASITVVDKQFIQDTGAKNIQDALLYSAGVYSGQFGFDTRGDWTSVRGLAVSKYQDGLRSIYGFYNAPRTEVYMLDSIEVLKGPSSVLYGQAELGGIINAVSKLPEETQKGEVWAQVGSFDRKQLAADVTGPLTEDGKWLYRLVALERDSGTQVDYVDDNAKVVAPSLTWKPLVGTKVTLLMNHQENDSAVSAQFLPQKGTLDSAPRGQIPTKRFAGEPSWDRYDQDRTDYTLFFEQRISDQWDFATTARQTDTRAETRESYTMVRDLPDDAGNIDKTYHTANRETDVFSVDSRFEGRFDLGVTKHTLAVGADQQDAVWEEWNYVSINTDVAPVETGGMFNVYDPVYGYVPALTGVDTPDSKILQTGFYVVDHMEIDKVVVSTSVRRDEARTISILVNGTESEREDKETTGRIGLMYRFDSGISPYISYSTSFVPNLGTGASLGLLEPTTGKQKEAGIKYLSLQNDLSVAFAWFDIEQEKRVVQSATVPQGVEQTGATVDGWEAEVKKRWDRFEWLVNYSRFDADDQSTGFRLTSTAEELASTWAKYNFANGLRAGLGARYTGDVVGAGETSHVPSVSLYDAMVGYEYANWDFSVDGKNLGDKTYVSWCRGTDALGRGDCGYGERRIVLGNVRYKF
ncbi:MAG TPA: TonB-dependent siderophore receptor, partial [Dongiaceae bacterium]|nr:TonB-dependent siderophore receptor [Dongiaceae bacterium]